MALKFYRVASVEGRQVLDPFTIGQAQQRRVGYTRFVEGEVSVGDKREPRIRYKISGEPEVVRETTDLYFKRAIVRGDLEYVETVLDFGTKTEKVMREPELVRATVLNRKARDEAAATLAAQAADAEKHAALELEAAEKGLTLAEFLAEKPKAPTPTTDAKA